MNVGEENRFPGFDYDYCFLFVFFVICRYLKLNMYTII